MYMHAEILNFRHPRVKNIIIFQDIEFLLFSRFCFIGKYDYAFFFDKDIPFRDVSNNFF